MRGQPRSHNSIGTLCFQIGNADAQAASAEEGLDGLKDYIHSKMWFPTYRPLVYLPPGKGE